MKQLEKGQERRPVECKKLNNKNIFASENVNNNLLEIIQFF